jgi:galactonate dehydratase
LSGWGEFTGNPLTDVSTSAIIAHLAKSMVGKDLKACEGVLDSIRMWRYPSHLDNRSIAMALSCLDMAIWDLKAQGEGVPLNRLLGEPKTDRVGLYGNLNRLLRKDRSTQSLINAAKTAIEAGLSMIKIAPFDEVTPNEVKPLFYQGIERWDLVSEAIGKDRISIDCHCRFNNTSFIAMIDYLGSKAYQAQFWEDPVRIHRKDDLGAVHTHSPKLRYASGEDCFRIEELQELAASGCFAILNPDLKYVGGPSIGHKAFLELEQQGVQISLHNPSGPVATAHSAHVSSLLAPGSLLEYSFGNQHFRDLSLGSREGITGGVYHLNDSPGIGLGLSRDFLEKYGSLIQEVTA